MCFFSYKMRCEICGKRTGTLHRFPNPNKFAEQFKAWVNVIGRKLENPEDCHQYKNKRICDIHFSMQYRNRNNRLSALAVPSLHLPIWCIEPSAAPVPVAVTNSEPTTEKVDSVEPSTIELVSEISDDKSRTEEGAITVHGAMEVDTAASVINVEHSYCLKSGFEQIVNIADHNAGPSSSVTLTAAKSIELEHNYYSKSSGSTQRGKRARVPRHNTSKPKSCARQLKNLKREILRLRKRGLSFKARLENAEKVSRNIAFQIVAKNMSKPAKIFTMMQYREASKNPKGRRFTTEEKVLSLSIFKRSPKCYKLLAKQFALPSSKSLKCLLSTVQLKQGINKIVFQKIKKTVSSLNNDKKLCIIMFDEMSITPQIHYDAAKDEIKGLTSYEKKFADHVLVFMIKGIKANFKQPVAYYFTNSLNTILLKTTIIDVIKHVQATGLQVICTVCDQSTVNVSTINSLIEETKSQYLRDGREYRFDHFKINNQILLPLYDVPHLLKGIRNNLLNKNLTYVDDAKNERLVKWEYFEMLYAADKSYGELRVAHKLTEEHINKEKIKKMRVKTAAQLFSHSVAVATEHLSARGDLPQECRDLIPLVVLLDKLFDSLNGNTFHIPNGKIYRGSVKRNSPHHLLWQNAVKILKTIKFIKKKNCGGKIRIIESTVPSVVNLIKTIEQVQKLWKILSEKYSFDTLLTRHLNQDPVENFFGNIRSYGARNVAPNCVSFEGAYKSLLLNNYSAPHSIQANCEEDNNNCLQTLDFFLTEKPNPDIPDKTNDVFVFNEDVLNTSEEISDKGQSNYVCGWVLTKCFKFITKKCETCKKDLSDNNKERESNSLIKAKEYNKKKKWLCYPNNNIQKIFKEIQRITCIFLKQDVPLTGLRANIKMMCDTLIIYTFTCALHKEKLKDYFVDNTIKVIIYSWCRSINQILSGKITYDFNDGDELKQQAQMYFDKHRRNKNPK